jgi:FMN phosphatase YigB (HAD superfamily)
MNVVFLFDVDNTLLDNDRVAADLRRHLDIDVDKKCGRRYWELFEELRDELGYADYLGALQRYRDAHPRDLRVLAVSHFLISYPFAIRLFPESLDAVDHAAALGTAAILSDGDIVFQPHKIHQSGLYDAVEGRVLVYVHKERELDDVEARYPADHYVLVDDKMKILTAVKEAWGSRVTTVWPRQGHYALDAADVARYPAPDVSLGRIGELVGHGLADLVAAAR